MPLRVPGRSATTLTQTNAAFLAVAAATLGAWTIVAGPQLAAQPQREAPPQGGQQRLQSSVTKEQFEKWMTELSDWGRWGKDGQRGALNLITPIF